MLLLDVGQDNLANVVEILPANSLFNFLCVCKNMFIQRHQFIKHNIYSIAYNLIDNQSSYMSTLMQSNIDMNSISSPYLLLNTNAITLNKIKNTMKILSFIICQEDLLFMTVCNYLPSYQDQNYTVLKSNLVKYFIASVESIYKYKINCWI